MSEHDAARIEMLEDLFSRIYAFADENKDFDTSFVDSVHDQFERKYDISDLQLRSLLNICEQWGI